jgi:Ni/Fe-hydrogenase 1 B-type cytochrome subunit
MTSRAAAVSEPLPGSPGSGLVRQYVWELPVRLTHWVVVLAILVLASTGYYMHDPFIFVRGGTAYLMGTARFVHVLAGFVLTAAFLVRIYWFFVGNRCARWSGFLPMKRKQWREMGGMVRYYTFLRWRPVHKVGHNPLAALAYFFILFLLFVSILTGFVLFSRTAQTAALNALFGWAGRWFGIQYIRLVHYFLMYIFLAFMIHHVYSAVLVSIEERNGLLESIVTGYKFIPEWELPESGCGPTPGRP